MRSAREARSIAKKLRSRPPARRVNNVRSFRERLLLTKAELARKAGISALTLARIESGSDCRVDTKRKIILALGLEPADRHKVFGDAPRHAANGVRKGR